MVNYCYQCCDIILKEMFLIHLIYVIGAYVFIETVNIVVVTCTACWIINKYFTLFLSLFLFANLLEYCSRCILLL